MSTIVLDRVTKEFGHAVRAVDAVELTIESGEFLVLVGPSGCGKTTLLRMIAGLESVTSGSIFLGDRDVTRLPPRQRDIAMVFQNYALYPHMSVLRNLAFGLRMRKISKAETNARVEDVARMLGLEDLLHRKPGQLSGGQRQRVAMGRAIARKPAAYLMDEPLSNLDAKLRVGMRAELARLHERLGVTTVYVTHDQIEAMTLGDRVAVIHNGKLEQVDTPNRLYDAPKNLIVAAFIGSPAMNLVSAVVAGDRVEFAGHSVPLDPKRRPSTSGPVVLGIRPEDIEDASLDLSGRPVVDVPVLRVEDLGAENLLIFSIDAVPVEIEVQPTDAEGGRARLLADEAGSMLVARVGRSSTAQPGCNTALAVDPARFHFFDPGTGRALIAR